MNDLERTLSTSFNPADWNILADWYADLGDYEREREWRERIDPGARIIKMLQLAAWQGSSRAPRQMHFDRLRVKVFRLGKRVHTELSATYQDATRTAAFQFDTWSLCAVFPLPNFRAGSPSDDDRKKVGRTLRRLMDSFVQFGKETSNGTT